MRRYVALLLAVLIVAIGCLSVGCSKTTNVEIPDASLGDISFKADNSAKKWVNYPADGTEITLSVTDGLGMVWTLTIPGEALMYSEGISMTPLSDFESSSYPGTITGGVMLLPSGLEFLVPAQLSVSHPEKPVEGLILGGNNQGAGLEFMEVELSDNGVSASVYHFSSALFNPLDDPKINELKKLADQRVRDAIKATREMLKQPLEIPTPPSIPLECIGDNEIKIASEYTEALGNPESLLIRQLLGAGRAYNLLHGNDDLGSLDWAVKLSERIMKKVNKLIKTYQPQPEKYLAVMYANSRYSRESAILGIHEDWLPRFSELVPWAEATRDHCVEQVRDKHNFKYFRSILELEKAIALFSEISGGRSYDEILETIKEIMTFEIYYELIYNDDDETIIRLKGDGKVKYVEQGHYYFGNATAEYTSYVVTFAEPEDKREIEPKAFPVNVVITFTDFCDKDPKVNIILEMIGSKEEEHVIIDKDGVRGSVKMPIVNMMADSMFEGTIGPMGSGFIFSLPMHNQKEIVANETIKEKQGNTTMTMYLQVTHTPER